MKMKLATLRRVCRIAIVEATKVGASPQYMLKETLRQSIQDAIASIVANGSINDEKELQELFAGADAALKALKMIPLEVWKKLPVSKK